MPALNVITNDKLLRLVGTPKGPTIIDVRSEDQERFIPGSLRRAAEAVSDWAVEFAGRSVVVVCETGSDLGPGVAAWLRQAGANAETLDGGIAAWLAAGLPTASFVKLPQRDKQGRTAWVTRARPKVDRIACPWLVRRFVDPNAIFLFVAPPEVIRLAERFCAAPFDVEGEGVLFSHRGEGCTFDAMLNEFGLDGFGPLARLAAIVRGADTGHPEIAPEAAGLLAVSLGLSRMFADDLEQLDAGMPIYDALYRWCRDATDETHNWTSHKPSVAKPKS